MSGLSLMALGPFQFQALGFGFTGRQKVQKTGWVDIPLAGKMDRSQWVGGKNRTETIQGVVFQEFGGQLSLEGIKLASRNGIVLPFVDLSSGLLNVFGMHTIREVSEDQNVFDRSGSALRNAYSIKLQRYEGALDGIPGLSFLGQLL